MRGEPRESQVGIVAYLKPQFWALHRVTLSLQDPRRPVDDVLSELVERLSSAWQHPSQTAVRIVYGDEAYEADDFREAPCQQTATFDTPAGEPGRIDVVYLSEVAQKGDDPFLDSEQDLLEAVASMLGTYLERRQYERQTRLLACFFVENPNPVLRISAGGRLLAANKG